MTTNTKRRHAVSLFLQALPKAWEDIATERTSFVLLGPNEPRQPWMSNDEKVAARLRGLRSLLVAAFVTRLLSTRAQQGDDKAHMSFAVNVIDRYRQIYGSKVTENGAHFRVQSAYAHALRIIEDEFIAEIMLLLATEIEVAGNSTDPRMVFDEGYFWHDVLQGLLISCYTPAETAWVRAGINLVVPNTSELQKAFSPYWQNKLATDKLPTENKAETVAGDEKITA